MAGSSDPVPVLTAFRRPPGAWGNRREQKCEEPESGGVEGIPGGLLERTYCRRTEDDQRAGGADVDELRERDTLRAFVEPGDQDAHRGHDGHERKKEGG